MKKITVLLTTVLLFYCFTVLPTLAVGSPSATSKEATPPGKKIRQELATRAGERQEQIRELRERVATKVAELKELRRRAWHGEIKEISGTTIVLASSQGDKTILTDEETNFLRIDPGGRRKIALSDLVVGEKIVAFGQVGSETGEMTGRVIIARVFPININGKVTAVDVEGGTLTVQTLRRGSFIVDVETTTKILVWERGKGLTKSGLSKIRVGDRVHVNGFLPTKPKEGENRLTANRILVLPGRALGILGSPSPTATPTVSPTTTP